MNEFEIQKCKRTRILDLFKKILKYKIVYISTGIGMFIEEELKQFEIEIKAKIYWYSVQKIDNTDKYFIDNIDSKIDKNSKELQIVVISDLDKLMNMQYRMELEKYIEQMQENIHFIIVTKNKLTEEYKKALIMEKLFLITTESLLYTKEEVKELCQINEIVINEEVLEDICHYTNRYPVFICYFVKELKKYKQYNNQLKSELICDINDFMKKSFLEMDKLDKRFLLKISFLETITEHSVIAVTGNIRCKETLDYLCIYGNYLNKKGEEYFFVDILKDVLKKEAKTVFFEDEINEIYLNIAFYYEKKRRNRIYKILYSIT